jgi:membrane protein required for colicin V production
MAKAAALLVTFILVYIALRMIGGALTRSVRQTSLSGLDRVLGLGVGLVRALVALGGFMLVIDAAMPPERMPAWITDAKLYPLTSAAGGALRTFAPQGLKVAHDVAPALADRAGADPALLVRHHHHPDDPFPGTEVSH